MTEKTLTKPWDGVPAYGRQLRLKEITEITGLKKTSVYELIKSGEFQPLIKVGKRASALPESWLAAFIEQRAKVSLEAIQ